MEKLFRFSRGSYFGGMREYLIAAEDDSCIVSVQGMNGDFVNEANCVSRQSVIEKIAKPLMALDWSKEYKPLSQITDGYTWTIEMNMDEFSFHSWGYVNTPKDYERVTASLEHALCSFIAYGEEYETKARIDKLSIWPRELRYMTGLDTDENKRHRNKLGVSKLMKLLGRK